MANIKEMDISSYLAPRAESKVEDAWFPSDFKIPDVPPPEVHITECHLYTHKFMYILLYLTFLMLLLSYHLLIICFYLVGIFIVFMSPNNTVFKIWTMRAIGSRIEYKRIVMDDIYNTMKMTIGFTVPTETVQQKPSFKYYNYILALTALILIVKTLKSTSAIFSSEGNILTSPLNDLPEEDGDIFLEKLEKDTGCAEPRRVPRPRTAQQWSNDLDPIPLVSSNEKTLNEPYKVENTVQKNQRYLTIVGEERVGTYALGICGDYAIANRHSFRKMNAQKQSWSIRVSPFNGSTTRNRMCTVTSTEMTTLAGDLILIRLHGSMFSDIRAYIPEYLLEPHRAGVRASVGGHKTIVSLAMNISVDDDLEPFNIRYAAQYEWPDHEVGCCGTAVLVQSQNRTVIGAIHSAGSPTNPRSYGIIFNSLQVAKAINTLKKTSVFIPVLSEGICRLPIAQNGLVTPSEKSPLSWHEIPSLRVLGGIENYVIQKPSPSTVRTTPLAKFAEELTGVSTKNSDGIPWFSAPPMGRIRNPQGEVKSGIGNFVEKVGKEKKSLDPIIMRQAIDVIKNHILTELKKRGITKLSPLDLEHAVNGSPENYTMRSIKPTTSGGVFYGNKMKHTERVQLPFKKDALMPLYSVRSQVATAAMAYKEGICAHPILGAQCKDEPRSTSKCLNGDTRVFAMSSYESIILNRMYLMPFYSLMCEHGDIFSTSIGINMHSTDVDDLINDFKNFSPNMMEGDYKGFDTSMPTEIGMGVNTLVYEIVEELGYNVEALAQVLGITSDNLNPTVLIEGILAIITSFQPSGKYATAEDNSLRGLIMLVYAFIVINTRLGKQKYPELNISIKYKPKHFFQYVLARTYGDDLLASVKVGCETFNNLTYQAVCQVAYGIGYTDAQKRSEMTKYLPLSETSFLKRTFIFREDLNHWVAPLELKSIMKSIAYTMPSRNVTADEQLIDSSISALRELFFHLEEEDYMLRRQLMADRVSEATDRDLNVILKLYPSFQEIAAQLYEQQQP
jgi:hypothetical protein